MHSYSIVCSNVTPTLSGLFRGNGGKSHDFPRHAMFWRAVFWKSPEINGHHET
jgi:hypothetical protein